MKKFTIVIEHIGVEYGAQVIAEIKIKAEDEMWAEDIAKSMFQDLCGQGNMIITVKAR